MDERNLEDRLAAYRPVVERAMAGRLFQLGSRHERRRRAVTVVAAATVAAGVVGWVALNAADDPPSAGSVGNTLPSVVATDVGVEPLSPPTTVRWCRTASSATATTAYVAPCRDMVALGDSVMLGAASTLRDAGLTVDAPESRQFADLVPLLAPSIAEQSPSSVVIHLGNSGPIAENDLIAVMDHLRDVPRVVVLTIDVDRAWTELNNALLRALPAAHPNVMVLDWDALAPSCDQWAQSQGNGAGDCFATDGFHLSETGAGYYTALITNVLAL